MRKILTFLVLLAFATTAWAGEKTITISRNDVAWESANTVYNVTKGGVELVMSGGMNNPNFLLMKQHTTITVKSHNFNIKRIVFHCLDNYTNDNLDPFYWGPTTLHIQYSQTHAETAGTLTYNYGGSSYDALWRSTKSTSPGNYPNGLPAGYELMFENEGKPVRFASIDITIEQETGDMYELVTSTSEINTTDNYMLVGRNSSTTTTGRALSVNPTGTSTQDNQTSVPVTLIDNGLRVKAVDDVQFINFKSSSTSTYNYYIKTGEQYLRSQSAYQSPGNYNNGFCLTKVPSATDYAKVKVVINESGNNSVSNWEHYADIAYQFSDTYNSSHYAIRHNNNNNQFRNLYVQGNTQQVYLYKPSTPLIVTTEVKPESPQGEDPYGTISLRDGILVENGISYSQKMDTVQFLATPKNGYKIKSVTIQEVKRDNNTHAITEVVGNVDILSSSQSINGMLYNFVMPGNGAHVIVEFEVVVYHNVYIQVNPSGDYGNVFLTEGYVVQNDQVKSYEGENVVFNVTPNPIDIEHEENGYHELYSVTVTYTEGGQTISYTYTDGNYNFTMPDADVTITATFIYDNGNPLYLLGTANGGEFLPYGPRFNYDNTKEEYYLDVYFKGTNEFGGNEDDAYGYFCLSWGKWTIWNEVNQQTRRAQPYDDNYLISTDAPQYTLCYDDNKQNAFKIPAGIYRIKVKSYGYHNDVLSIERTYPTLTFDPAGGATAAEAVEVGQHQLVALQGDLYNKIKAINPNEADANFMYKATKTVAGEATTETENATTSTSTISVLDEVNDGETVTQLDGWNYLGWIVAENTAYYKVTETPLHWIEEYGDKDKTYTVSDRLQGVYAQGSSLWCKDVEYESIVKTEPYTGQVDYLAATLTTADHLFPNAMRIGNWDQSNWVELDFSGFGQENGNAMASALENKYIQEKTITGVYTNDVNYTIKVTSTPVADGDASYVPNTYCTSNFIESNLTLKAGDTGPAVTKDGATTYYYFLNPKIQEYAIITYAMWDKDNQIMVTPNNSPFNGEACIGRWDLNEYQNQLTALDAAHDAPSTSNNQYEFHIIVQRTNKNYGSPQNATVQSGRAKTSSSVIRTQPLDLKASSPLPTAISTVSTEAQVVGVEYVNIAGMRSNKPFSGVNIVVTRYGDGSTTTTKMVK
ncbi:MAG: hypothetical protein J5629_07340 [Muribaculaceae bacterium]|nr:hypothetical protein [Muribaculaceae bacterium]